MNCPNCGKKGLNESEEIPGLYDCLDCGASDITFNQYYGEQKRMSDTTQSGCQELMLEMLDDQGLDFTLAALSGALRFKTEQLKNAGHGFSVTMPWSVAVERTAALREDLQHLKL